jgi:hypothetical protein
MILLTQTHSICSVIASSGLFASNFASMVFARHPRPAHGIWYFVLATFFKQKLPFPSSPG